jgi:TolA-binding protein
VKAPEAPVAEAPARDEAGALFGIANDKRRSGDLTGALAGYADLVARFPSSREASTARALRGRIFLEQHEARRALTEFDAYLASGRGELREEALVGRARAFGLLGRTDSERTAWETLLSSYPSSASTEHARLRLQTLGSR